MDTKTDKLTLELGDIISIISKKHHEINNKTYLIEYIDKTQIHLLQDETFEKIKIYLKDDRIENYEIDAIQILYRQEQKGYARQNGFLTNTWISIQFGGDLPTIIHGKITDIEEDMIEIKTYPDDMTIYIDFKYQGIPLEYNILDIKIRQKPDDTDKEDKEDEETKEVDFDDIDKQSVYSEDDDAVHPLSGDGIEKTKQLIKANLDDGDAILNDFFIEDELEVEIEVLIDEKKRRVDLETQLNDLLDSLKSRHPTTYISTGDMKRIHTMVSRFKQLREEFSQFDDTNNRLIPKRRGANFKPLVNKLKTLEEKIEWIYPISYTRRNLYKDDIDADKSVEEKLAIKINTHIDVIGQEVQYQNDYNRNVITDDTNKYEYLIKQQSLINRPYEIDANDNKNIIHTVVPTTKSNQSGGNIETFSNTLTQKGNDMYSSVITENKVNTQRFVIQKFNLGVKTITKPSRREIVLKNITNNEPIPIQSFITLPKPFMEYSKVKLPGSSIYERVNKNISGIKNWNIFNPKTSINTDIINIKESKDPKEDDIDDKTKTIEQMMYNIKQYVLDTDIIELDDDTNTQDKYEQFLEKMIPKTRDIIEWFKKTNKQTTNFVNVESVMKELEPFYIYKDDLSFKQYTEIVEFLQKSILNLKNIISNTIRKTRNIQKIVDITKSFESIYFTLAITYNDMLRYMIENRDNITDNEFIFMNEHIDDGRLLNNILATINAELYTDIDIKETVENAIRQIEQKKQGIDEPDTKKGKKGEMTLEERCENAILAKMYASKEELTRDNGKTIIYFDEKYDPTRYEFIDGYKTEQETMGELEYMDFLTNKLKENVGMSTKQASIEARSLIDGKRSIRTGNYAFIPIDGVDEFGKPKTSMSEYYYWSVDNKWIYDDSITSMATQKLEIDPSIDINNVFCNVKDTCIINKKDACVSIDENKDDLIKDSYKEMLKNMSEEAKEITSQMKPKLEKLVNDTFEKYKELVKFKTYLRNENTIKHYNYGTELVKYDIIVSPYAELRDKILGDTADKSRQMMNIIKFYNEFTQPAIIERGDDLYWYYCRDTQTKLLPTFFVELATTYINGDDVETKMLEIIRTRGQHVDNMIVDKYSGYVIRMIDMDTDEGYNEQGYKIVTKDILEHKIKLGVDEDDIFTNILDKEGIHFDDKKEDETTKMTKTETEIYESPIGIQIRNILLALKTYIGIDVSKYNLYIIQEIRVKLQEILKSKKQYEAINKKLAEKGKKTIPYDKKRNELIVLFTGIYYLFVIQVSIPHLTTRKTFPGCNKDFDGAPMYDGTSGLNYIACVLKKISSSQEPWDSIHKLKEPAILKRMNTMYEKYIQNTTDINNRITEKENYIKSQKDDPTALVDMYKHSLHNWFTFQPLLIRHGKEAELLRQRDIHSNLKTEYKNALKNGTKRGDEIYNLMVGSLKLNIAHIYNEINKIVNKEAAMLTTKAGEGFLENACCTMDLSSTKETNYTYQPLQYFLDRSENMVTYVNNARTISTLLSGLQQINQPYKLVENTDTKLKYPSINKTEFSEETIYRAFIKYCRFNTDLPVPENIKTICNTNVSAFNNTDTITDKIEIMKNEGLLYNSKSLKSLLTAINKPNTTHLNNEHQYSSTNPIFQNIFNELKTDFLSMKTKTKIIGDTDEDILPLHVSIFNEHIQGFFITVFELFDIYGSPDIDTTENRNTMIDTIDSYYNYLHTANTNMLFIIKNFINKYSNIKKTDKKKLLKFITEFHTFSPQNEKGTTLQQGISQMKHILYMITQFFTSMVINNSSSIDIIDIPKHWGLSVTHKEDITAFIKDTFEGIKIHSNTTVKNICKNIIDETHQFIDILNKIPVFLDDNLFDEERTNQNIIELSQVFFGKNMTNMLYQYVILNVFTRYIHLSEQTTIIIDETKTGEISEVDIKEGNVENDKRDVCNFLGFMSLQLLRHRNRVNYNRQEILNMVFKIREREKDTKTRRLKELTDEERKVDNELKKAKLGAWNKGLQKGLYAYVKGTYDEERLEMEKEAILDAKLKNKAFVTDMNKEIYKMEILEEALYDKQEEDEENDLSGMIDDDDYSDDDEDDTYRLRYEQTFYE